MNNPRDYGIPHDEFRTGQHELLQSLFNNRGNYVMLSAPTGTGKSSLACGLGHQERTLVLVHTLALLTQYERDYGFSVVRGRQEYKCVNEEKIAVWKKEYRYLPMASECHYSPMHDCPFASECPYILAKKKALAARRSACTYRYAGVSGNMQERKGHLVMDEAHDAAEELIGFNAFNVRYMKLFDMSLPLFPIQRYGDDNRGDLLTKESKEEVIDWLDRCMYSLAERIDETKEGADAQKTFDRFGRMAESLFDCDWFLRINDGDAELLALSAKHVAQRIFANKETKLLMSATIGNPDPLAKALGIDDYKFIEAPHPTPPKFRSVKDLGMDRMIKRNLVQQRELPYIQAELIWRWISGMPEKWRGLIVTTSYQKIKWLEQNLQLFNKRKRRLIVQGQDMSVSDAIDRFITDVRDGDILIGTIQGMGSGLDLYGNLARWMVVAGTPHANPTDYYDQARRNQEGGIDYQYWVTYNAIVQACGRVARGEKDEDGNWLPNYCAIADGSATTKTAMKYYSEWFKEAII